MFLKSSVGWLSNFVNAKKYIWSTKYTIQHRIERSQASKCIQYDIYDTMSCELPKYKICNKCTHVLITYSFLHIHCTLL